jgi:hypothetical protein
VRIYQGAVIDRETPPTTAETWARESQDAIWVWLELDAVVSRGAGFARVFEDGQLHEIDLPAEAHRDGARVHLPLWIDRDLRGGRTRSAIGPTIDRIAGSVVNLGDVPREVWFEEPLRPFAQKQVDDTKDYVTVVGKTAVRVARKVPASGVDRFWFTIRYAERE